MSNRFPDVPDLVAARLSGYIDAEAHFAIINNIGRRNLGFACAFRIHVRDDDREILDRFQKITGLGRMYHSGNRATADRANRPYYAWAIARREECLRLVEIIDPFPLWSKKRRDFTVWAEAVRYWNGPKPEGWAPMARWWEQIRVVREYSTSAWTEAEISALRHRAVGQDELFEWSAVLSSSSERICQS